MTTFYDEIREVAVDVLQEFKQGTVTLTRTSAPPDTGTPWTPGTATTTVYTLDAVVSGVAKRYVDGTLILASDLQLTVSPKATDADGVVVDDVAPQLSDIIAIDGAARAVRSIKPTPAAGTVAVYMIFVQGP